MSKHPPKRWKSARVVVTALAAGALMAGCQNPGTQPTFVLGNGQPGEAPALPPMKINPGGDTYFTLALPPEPSMPRHATKVEGTAGSYSKLLMNEASPVVAAIIPNQDGFIIEGAKLNATTLKFYIGSKEMTVVQRLPHQVVVKVPRGVSGKGIITIRNGALNLVRAAADAGNVYVNGRAVVRFKEGAPRATIEAALKNAGIRYYRFPGMNFVVAYYDPQIDFTTIQPKLMSQSVFEEVTRDTLFFGRGTATAEPRYGEQWYLPKINADKGWAYTAGSPDALIAIVDTGLQMSHPDLDDNIYRNLAETPNNGKDDDGNGRIDDVNGWNSYDSTGNVADDNGHGTQMAGLAAAAADGYGMVGLSYGARVIPIKACNQYGVGTSSSVIEGINYAVRNRASVINLAVGSKINDPAVKSAVEFATTFNVSVLAAMGNDGARVLEFPAGWSKDIPGLIAVGVTNSVDRRPAFANYGDWMTVCAPGEAVLTTELGSKHVSATGSSHATAIASGFAAMIKALKPGYTPAQIKEIITKTAVDLGTPGFDNDYGHGRINLDGALAELVGNMDIESSSEHPTLNFPAKRAIDKNTETYWSSARRGQDNPEWLILDLGSVRTVNSIAALSGPHYPFLFPADFTLDVSTDATKWTTVASEVDFQIGTTEWHRWNVPSIAARWVRMNITKSRINPDNGLYYDQVAEFLVNGEESAIIKTASSNYYGVSYPSWHVTDGDATTHWVSTNRRRSEPEFVIADLGLSQSISSISLLSPSRIIYEAFPKAFKLYVSSDKQNWQFVGEARNVHALESKWYRYPVRTTTGRYIRVDITETNFARSHGSLFGGFQLDGYTAAIAEVQVNRIGN